MPNEISQAWVSHQLDDHWFIFSSSQGETALVDRATLTSLIRQHLRGGRNDPSPTPLGGNPEG